ncbi:uncharacterized protein LOC135845038 [Planococcus citri]|uniref:uncharacterized protein LOC135845038 n=1 Tax=Planococcus citri TaxID=170843 RepID=UPI0031F9B37A
MPAMSFLETETIHSQGKQYTRPRVGARKELLPMEQKFHYVSAIKRYFPSITEYRDVRNLLISEIARIESFKERMATLPTQAEVEYLGSDTNENTTEAPIYQILTLKNSDLGNRLKPERKIKNAIRNLYNDPAILSDSPTAMSLGEILVAKINEQRFHKMINKKKKQNIEFIDAIDNTPLKNEKPDPVTSSQLVTQKTNDPACVIPVTIGARKVALQLDTGALPNVLSRLMVKTFLEEAPNWVKFIKLKKQVQLRLANNTLIPSATHIIELQMILGNEMIKVPFYIIDAPGQTFILGRISMDYLKMKLNVPERLVKCRPEFCEKFTIPFMHTDEFQSALTVFSLVTNEQEHETFSEDMSDTHHTIIEQEIFEERRLAQRTFKENLRADLNMALENGSITFQQAIRGFDRLQHFADIFDLNPGKYTGEQVKFTFQEGNTHLQPWRGEKFRPSKKLLPALRKAITKMLALGIIKYSHSCYINTLAPVVKKNGDIRLCLDADELNKFLINVLTEPNTIASMLYDNAGDKFFCTLDFTEGFWQLELDLESRKFTAFQVEGQVYEFTRLPYGLKISSGEFVHMINQVIENEDGITKYVDDIKISGTTFEETIKRLEKVFHLIREHGLKLNPTKTQFFKNCADHLGFVISDKGIGKQSEKIRKLEEFEKKHTKRGKFSLSKKNDILALVGNTGLYRDFIPEYSQIVNPIYHLTKGDVPVEWTEKQQKAFETLKAEFKKDFKLQQAPKEGDLFLDTQLSDDSMNGVLFYMVENDKRIIMFISIAFKEHQKKLHLI